MSQAAFLQAFDEAAFGAFAAAGIADAAQYVAPGAEPDAAPTPCMVLVDRNVEDFGDDASPVSVQRIRITFQRRELSPAQGGRVSLIDADGGVLETFELVQRTRADESASAWWVQEAAGG